MRIVHPHSRSFLGVVHGETGVEDSSSGFECRALGTPPRSTCVGLTLGIGLGLAAGKVGVLLVRVLLVLLVLLMLMVLMVLSVLLKLVLLVLLMLLVLVLLLGVHLLLFLLDLHGRMPRSGVLLLCAPRPIVP